MRRWRIGVQVIWYQWTVGFIFGPGWWEIELGPLSILICPPWSHRPDPDWVYGGSDGGWSEVRR